MRFWGNIPYTDTNLPASQASPLKLHCTMWLHIIEETVENRKFTYEDFLDTEGVFDSTSFALTKAATQYSLGDTICQKISSMLGGNHSHAHRRNSRQVCDQGLSIWEIYHLCCEAWLWMNSQEDSMGMAVIHWGMQLTLQPSSREYYQTLSQSFYRRPWVSCNSDVTELSCLLILKRWWEYHSPGREI